MRASDELVEFYNRVYSNRLITEVHATLDSVLTSGDPAGISSNDWWNKTNQTIDALIRVETHSFDKIREKAEAELAAINRNVMTNVVAGLIIRLIIGVTVSLTIRQILSAIAELKRAAHKLAQGEVDFTVNVTSGDEMADLAESFNKMVAVKKLYAETAEKIGKGNYQTPILVRTGSDILGIALNNMKNDLKRLSSENEIRTWLLTGNSKLNDHICGDKATPVLATEVITQLTEFLNAQIGALYVRENGHMRLAGRYAFHENGETKYSRWVRDL
jgi:HAMP domain-containing protein